MQARDVAEPTPDALVHRRTMVDCQIRPFDVTDHAVIGRFLAVPRENFLPPDLAPFAYSDMGLKLAAADPQSAPRFLLPPAVAARLIQAAGIKPGDKILDVAPATGYSTALLAGLAHEVVAIESAPVFAEAIKANLASVGLAAQVVLGSLVAGVASSAPYDVIFVNGAVEARLEHLFAQLRSGGRLLTIVRRTVAAGYGACHAVRFESQAGRISSIVLFDADAPVLDAFRKEPEFVF